MHGKNSKETSRRATSAIWRIFAELNNPIRALSKTELNIDGGKSSSETQGQIVGARESLNGRENMARRKVKKAKRASGDNVLPDQFQTVAPFWLLIGQKNTKVFWHQSEARTAATVWNWSGKTLSPGALLAVLYFSSSHISPPI